ncbi:MAG TPA: hypothetical protein DD400_01480 [Rhodospirillaceae bacterium]|nr:hypothetical protein [Rhodospirillaceae bacterium]
MDEQASLIFSLLAGVQREKGFALLSRTMLGLSERDAFEAQAARNEAILSQIREKHLPQNILLPNRILQSLALRSEAPFKEGLDHDSLSEWYLFHLEHPIHQAVLAVLIEWNGLNPSQTSAIIHLLAALGYMSQLRDVGLGVYAKGEISSVDTARIKMLALAYLARERLFLNLADEDLREKMRDLKVGDPETQMLWDDFLRKLKEGYAKGLISQTPPFVWFHTLDALLEKFYETLVLALEVIAQEESDTERFGNMANALDSDVEKHIHAIADLPLFRGIPENVFRNVLKGARLMEIERNVTFLTQGEPIDRFFIFLDGLAKSFKSTEDGSEVIVQIIGKKECLLDMGTLGSVATIGARTISHSRVLALSLSALREQSMRSSTLARNLLTVTSSRLQKFVAHFEQITLRNATQRVGGFLVNLHLETGLEGAPLKLPFEKALIASYLNIKPETFSRVLKQFRKDGFVIEKNEVILPHPHALCAFCDPEMAPRCCRAEAENCQPIRVARRIVSK